MGRIRLRRRLADDSGVSLIELMIVMLLSGLVLAMIMQFYVTVARSTTDSDGTRNSTAEASNIMNVVSTSVRAAVDIPVDPPDPANPPPPAAAVRAGTLNDLTITTYTDAGPSFPVPLQIRYYVDSAGRMIEQRWVANGCDIDNPSACVAKYPTYPATTTTPDALRVLGNLVVNRANCVAGDTTCTSDPLFSYFASDRTTRLGLGSGGLTAAERDQVAYIRFNLKVRGVDSSVVVELDNTVGMPNLS
jgi:prepilin-type N-terminal cleavage/methylation domain-containing protein